MSEFLGNRSPRFPLVWFFLAVMLAGVFSRLGPTLSNYQLLNEVSNIDPDRCLTPTQTVLATRIAAIACIENQDLDRAQQLANTIASSNPNNAYIHHLLGKAYFEAGDLEAAQIAWLQSSSLIKLRELAVSARLAGELDLAIETNRQTVDLWQISPVTDDLEIISNYFNLALANEELGQPLEAAQAYESVISIRQGDYRALIGAARNLRQIQAYDEAESYLVEAIQLQPDRFEGYMEYGLVLTETEREAEAINYYEAALQRAPAGQQARIEGYLSTVTITESEQ